VEGDFDLAVFTRAWQAILDRHANLRAGIVWEGTPQPLHAVRSAARVPVTELDWRDLGPDAVDQRYRDFLDRDKRTGFTMSRAPLLRLAYLRLDERTWRIVWTFHHAVLDGWSIPIVL